MHKCSCCLLVMILFYRKVYKCPDDSDKNHNFCLWNASTNPPHRLPYEEYFFKLTGENNLGSLVKKYTINHYGVGRYCFFVFFNIRVTIF